MCGIAGIFDIRGTRAVDVDLLKRMTRTLEHRGPDGEGYHVENGVGFGHRRLSIIDIEGGKQPLYNEDDSVCVTYNGEIYNFRDLQLKLEACGHHFRTRCDTEVIVHAWEEWGEDCVNYFNGMFAFAIWDRNRQCVFLARDRIGIKPLYYSITPSGQLLFSSELKAIMAHPEFRRDIRPDAVEDYFAFSYVPDPKTIFESAEKLAPGHTLLVKRGASQINPRQYWDVPFGVGDTPSGDALYGEIVDRLRSSVQRRLIADVPLGAFLSGGVDSSAVVAMMSELSEDPVNTTSISFGDPKFNEAQFADIVARKFGTDHQVREVDPDDFSLVGRLPGFYDEPFADSSALPTFRVCQLARSRVTVALSGDGGDENFIGYRRYRWHAYEEKVRSILPQIIRGPVFGAAGALYPKMDWAPKVLRAKSTLQALARDSLAGYFNSVSIFPAALRRKLFSQSFSRKLQGYTALEIFRSHAERAPVKTGLPLVQYLDFKTYLPGDILTKVDRASMATSLEVRVPLLDHEFVEWVAGIPASLKLNGREGKYCFKKALEHHLPEDILYREKMGFAVPIGGWFRGPLKQEIRHRLLEVNDIAGGIFSVRTIEQLLDDHQSGAREYSPILWALLMFDGSLRHINAS